MEFSLNKKETNTYAYFFKSNKIVQNNIFIDFAGFLCDYFKIQKQL